jgi:hypothetical protein
MSNDSFRDAERRCSVGLLAPSEFESQQFPVPASLSRHSGPCKETILVEFS